MKRSLGGGDESHYQPHSYHYRGGGSGSGGGGAGAGGGNGNAPGNSAKAGGWFDPSASDEEEQRPWRRSDPSDSSEEEGGAHAVDRKQQQLQHHLQQHHQRHHYPQPPPGSAGYRQGYGEAGYGRDSHPLDHGGFSSRGTREANNEQQDHHPRAHGGAIPVDNFGPPVPGSFMELPPPEGPFHGDMRQQHHYQVGTGVGYGYGSGGGGGVGGGPLMLPQQRFSLLPRGFTNSFAVSRAKDAHHLGASGRDGEDHHKQKKQVQPYLERDEGVRTIPKKKKSLMPRDDRESGSAATPMHATSGGGDISTPNSKRVTPESMVEVHMDSISRRRKSMERKRQAQEEKEARLAEEKAHKDAIRRARRMEKKRLEKKKEEADARRKSEGGAARLHMDALKREQEARQLCAEFTTPGSGATTIASRAIPDSKSLLGDVQLSEEQREAVLEKSKRISKLVEAHQIQLALLQRQYEDVAALRRKLAKDEQKKNGSQSHHPVGSSLAKTGSKPALPEVGPLKLLAVPLELSGPVLSCWDFLWSLESLLGLSHFSIDSFCEALNCDSGPSVLLTEIHCRLLHLLLKDGRGHKQWLEAMGVDDEDVFAAAGVSRAEGGGAGGGGASSSLSKAVDAAEKKVWASPWKSAKSPVTPRVKAEGEEQQSIRLSQLMMGILPPVQSLTTAPQLLLTPLSWQMVLYVFMPKLGPFARALHGGSKDSLISTQLQNWLAAHEKLGDHEYHALPVSSKVHILQLLLEASYETKRVRARAQEDHEERQHLESKKREEVAKLNRTRREELAAKKEVVVAEIKERLQREWEEQGSNEKNSAAAATADGGDANNDSGNGTATSAPAPSGKKQSSKSSKKSKGGGGGTAEGPREPHYTEINKALEEIAEKEAVGCKNFIVKDVPALPSPEGEKDAMSDGDEQQPPHEASDKEENAESGEDEDDHCRQSSKVKDKKPSKKRGGSVGGGGGRWRKKGKHAKPKMTLEELREARSRGEQALAHATSLVGASYSEQIKKLEMAIGLGKKAEMEGRDDDGQKWIGTELHAAYLLLHKAKERDAMPALLKKYDKLYADKFLRWEPIGLDSRGTRYWVLASDPSRLYLEEWKRMGSVAAPGKPSSEHLSLAKPDGETLKNEVTKYNPLDWNPAWYRSIFRYLDDPASVSNLIFRLDEKDAQERMLKQNLEVKLDTMRELQRASIPGDCYDWVIEGECVGRRLLRCFGGGQTSPCKIVAMLPAEANEGMALWHVVHDDGDEEDLEEDEMKEAIREYDVLQVEEKKEGRGPLPSHLAYRNLLSQPSIDPGLLTCKAFLGELLAREAHVHKTVTNAGWQLAKGKEAEASRSEWVGKIKSAIEGGGEAGDQELPPTFEFVKSSLLKLEARIHGMQEAPEVYEDDKMAMMSRGWLFNDDAHPAIGTTVRFFYKEVGPSDAIVRAYLPPKKDREKKLLEQKEKSSTGGAVAAAPVTPRDPAVAPASAASPAVLSTPRDGAKWYIVHDNGDDEVISHMDLIRGTQYKEENLEEPPSDYEDDGDADEDQANEGRNRNGKDDEEDNGEGSSESEEEAEFEDDEDDDDDDDLPSTERERERETLWATWTARQAWINAVEAALILSSLEVALASLLENAKLFGACKETIITENRARARKAALQATSKASSTRGGKRGQVKKRRR